jgi:two-component system chemotaxis sensor kinase CheA
MASRRDQLFADIDRRLNRLACDVIVDPSPASVGRALDELWAALEEGGLPAAAAALRELAGASGDPQALPAALEARWHDWVIAEEMRADLEMFAADPEIANMFVAEALDHLGTIEATLLRLEEAPEDKALINDVFRPFHTIKGNAGALGITTVQEFAHIVESLLDRCRSGAHHVGASEIDIVLKAVDLMTAMITDLSARAAGKEGRSLRRERLELSAAVQALIDNGGGESIAGAPASAQATTPAAGPHFLAGTPAAAAPDAAPAAAPDVPPAAAPAADPVERRAADPRPPEPRAVERRPVEMRTPDAPDPRLAQREQQVAVKVDTRKLDTVVDTVGELVILQSLITQNPALARIDDDRLTRNLADLQRLTSELQRGAMAMRMVPIRQTFQKMSRLVRDLSRASGKQVELITTGEDTELDRRVVEDINDPLMHMVRNSMDHGLEPADRRTAAGKPALGRLHLRAFHQGGNIVIQVADDGAGLDTDRILAKAVSQGLVAPDERLAPEQIYDLIFRPGFSTAEKVTEISGRGVGMDVVKRNIEALRGRIEIQSERGRGTTFSIKLPLTLAILDGLLVGVGPERFVIPTFAIRESLRPAREDVHTINGEPRMIRVRDRLMPLMWLSEVFALNAPSAHPSEATVVVIEDEARSVGLVVDVLLGKQEVVVKPLGDTFAEVRGVAGGAILGDGRIGLILDAHGLLHLLDRRDKECRAEAA